LSVANFYLDLHFCYMQLPFAISARLFVFVLHTDSRVSLNLMMLRLDEFGLCDYQSN